MYKLSKYIYFVEKDNIVMVMTLLNQNIFGLMREKADILRYSDLNELEKTQGMFFSAMKKLGVIVDADLDELNEVKFRNRQAIFADRSYRLTINPTLNCNFSCWYCYENHPEGRMSDETVKQVMKHLKNKIEKEKIPALNLDWFGGEPFMYFDEVVVPISKKAVNLAKKYNIGFSNSATTNGYLLNEARVRQCKELGFNNFQITLDGNKKLHDKIRFLKDRTGSFDKIVENINFIAEIIDKVSVALRINYTEKTLQELDDIIPFFSEKAKSKILILFQQVWQDSFKKQVDSSEVSDKFKANGFKIREYTPNVAGSVCYADKENQAVINYDGKVFKCTARDFHTYPEDGILLKNGIIEWNNHFISKRLGISTFENKYCLDCNLLPACYGPCSQKMMEFNGSKEDFLRICYKGGVVQILERMMNEYYENEIKYKIQAS
ncbi:MAG: radical SAM protein [Tannerella sp.]|jgi:uncharacterized protein|nr:radical SAM protein [Tannerella sp.]